MFNSTLSSVTSEVRKSEKAVDSPTRIRNNLASHLGSNESLQKQISFSGAPKQMTHLERGLLREGHRVDGFGQSAGGALIGNNNRFGGSAWITPSGGNPRQELAKIGWAVTKPNLD